MGLLKVFLPAAKPTGLGEPNFLLRLCLMVDLNLLTTKSDGLAFTVVRCEKIKIYHQAETSKKMSLCED